MCEVFLKLTLVRSGSCNRMYIRLTARCSRGREVSSRNCVQDVADIVILPYAETVSTGVHEKNFSKVVI